MIYKEAALLVSPSISQGISFELFVSATNLPFGSWLSLLFRWQVEVIKRVYCSFCFTDLGYFSEDH